ncbi:MAG: DUF1003 domain-containing protein [archaeon]
MENKKEVNVICYITKKPIKIIDAVPYDLINLQVIELIKKKYPEFNNTNYISREEYKKYRYQYMEDLLKKEKGEISKIDKQVVKSMIDQESLVKELSLDETGLSKGQRIADKVATFGGSWGFISSFFIVLVIWIIINTSLMMAKPYDPYPFILLNLILSCLAAIQAPIIMMSQNRKEQKDRLRSENDYKINLKAELEIRHIHEKLDHLTRDQWQRLLEIQKLQLDILEEQERKNKKNKL